MLEAMTVRGSRRAGGARALSVLAGAVLAGALTACQVLPWRRDTCSGEVADLGVQEAHIVHVRVELEREGHTRRHEVIVRVAPGQITAVGLTPMGTHAFRVSHDASGIEVENHIGRYLGYAPRLVYDAVARAFLAPGAVASPNAEVDSESCGYRARLVLVSDQPALPESAGGSGRASARRTSAAGISASAQPRSAASAAAAPIASPVASAVPSTRSAPRASWLAERQRPAMPSRGCDRLTSAPSGTPLGPFG